ncbi:MAG TPA: condensation domain-containing protein [Actinocrinis sp.]|nr:condensation domain-containing protein [Actinocrinis sp.]
MTEATRSVVVRYAGQSSGSGPLTLGQDNMIRCILHDDPAHINKHVVWPVPPGVGVDSALYALQVIAGRHEALRTVYPGSADVQPTVQEVRADGEFTVDVFETAGDPEELAWEIGLSRLGARFDLAADFPLRLALVIGGGRLAWISVVVCHAAADAVGTAVLFEDWKDLATGRELPPLTAPTPRDLAAQERSSSGERRAKASLRHWERILRTCPHAVFADSDLAPSTGSLPTFMLHSVSMAANCAAAAQRTGTSPSTIMFAAYVAVVSQRAAQQTIVLAALSANRHRAGLEDYVGSLAQDALISLDTDAEDFDELISRAASATMAGYWHSTFDSRKIWQIIDDVGYLRGARFARHVVLNDLSVTIPEEVTRNRPVPAEDPQLTWLPEKGIPTRLMLNIWRLRDCVELTLHADPRLFDQAETEQLALGMMRLVEAAAAGPVPLAGLAALTGIVPGRREGEWNRIGSSWIELDAVRELLDLALAKRPVRVQEVGGRLVARIADDDRPLTPEQAHRAVMATLGNSHRLRGAADFAEPGTGENITVGAALSGWESAMAPQEYVICAGSPSGPDQDWSGLPVAARGDGREGATDWAALLS